MTSDIGLEKLGGWRRLEQGWGRLWSGHTCLACLPVHVCAYDTCKWRRQRGSWGCRPQTQGQLRLEERVLCRERAQTFRPQDLVRPCLPGALQRPESFSDFVGWWAYVFIYLVLFCFVFSYSLFQWEGARLPVCMFLQP